MSSNSQGPPAPETFYDIQDDATGAILRMLPILILTYSISLGILGVVAVGAVLLVEVPTIVLSEGGWFRQHWEWVFLVSAGFGVLSAPVHALVAYTKSIDDVFERTGAEPLDRQDHYHKTFRNVVDEISLAAGITTVETAVIPTGRTNALSVGDTDRALVIITEGALGRLRRDELQAVVAHEIAHVAYGDSRLKYFTSNLLQTFELLNPSNHAEVGFRTRGSRRGGGIVLMLVLAIVTPVLKSLNRLLSTGISQQREWRADATAVEYCRDPLALASALHKLGMLRAESSPVDDNVTQQNYRDAVSSTSFEPLLLVPFNSAGRNRSSATWFEKLFRSHPPLYGRIEKNLNLAHVSYSDLQTRLSSQRSSPHVPVQALRDQSGNRLDQYPWWIQVDGENHQLSLPELLSGESLTGGALVARGGEENWSRPEEHRVLNQLKQIYQIDGKHGNCPDCNVSLRRRFYLGVPIEACVVCGGVALPWRKTIRLETRHRDGELPEHLGDISNYSGYHGASPIPEQEITEGQCPDCGERFEAKRYKSADVIVDQCPACKLTWFEEDELTIALNL